MKGTVVRAVVGVAGLLAPLLGGSSCQGPAVGPETGGGSLTYGILRAVARDQGHGVLLYADLDALRPAVHLDRAGEGVLLDLIGEDAHRDVQCWRGVREIGVFGNEDRPGDEVFLVAVETCGPEEIEGLLASFPATLLESADRTPPDLTGDTWYAIRVTETCLALVMTDHEDALAAESLPLAILFGLREDPTSLAASPGATALLAGTKAEFPWPAYDLLVQGAAGLLREQPETARLLNIVDYARACQHVDGGFDDGGAHCRAIPEFAITVDVETDTVTWDLTYQDEGRRAILEKAITSMDPATSQAIALDWSATRPPRIHLRHLLPDVRLDGPAVEAIRKLVRPLPVTITEGE